MRYVVKLAYISCVDQYAKIEELPSGHGMADIVFLPKRRSSLPAIVIELKWNKNAKDAVGQILEKKYQKVLEQFEGEIILVGTATTRRARRIAARFNAYQVLALDFPVRQSPVVLVLSMG